ncbi:hypothetical protein [Nostoc sp.]|uniref:hypothetical protein n=1 Tax=Nostoc sp. TaxID=1180 RepID=UPI002FF75A36
MKFSSYKVHTKHRASKPTEDVSIWTVPEWTEIQLFGIASQKQWCEKGVLWAAMVENSKIAQLGIDIKYDLYIAKYKCDPNLEWHGYPVHPENHDIPPEQILEAWRKENIIDKADKRKIKGGQFKK